MSGRAGLMSKCCATRAGISSIAQVVDRVFRDNAEHPPLGRWLLGIASELGEPIEVLWKGPDPTGHYVLAGRLAPASGVRRLGLPGHARGRPAMGAAAGAAAGFRARGHAPGVRPRPSGGPRYILEPVLDAGSRGGRSCPAVRAAQRWPWPARAVLWGLALLTKIHAWFLLPILGAWSFVWLSPRRAISAMLTWTVAGISLFWLGWPWLWYDSWNRLQAYLGTGVARSTIMVQYFGQVVADRDVPWHYPWFYFAATVPIGLLAFGAIGIARGWNDRRADPFPLLLAGTIVVFLAIFSTRVPVYDGERLFLHVFPAWAMLVGSGFWLALGTTPHQPRGAVPRWRSCCRSRSMASSRCTRSGSATTMGWSADCRAQNGWDWN